MSSPQIIVLPAFSDNYMYLVVDGETAALVDPSDADLALTALSEHALTLTHILVTHHHNDHIAGLSQVKDATGAKVFAANDPRIPGVDRTVEEGDSISYGNTHFSVLETPGHGDKDCSYLLHRPKGAPALFCGDTLFVGGCGRILGGTAEQLWKSLQKLAGLPDDTEIYCGHEYTEDNIRFALSRFPDKPVLQTRLESVQSQRHRNQPSVPSTLLIEKETNVFLSAKDFESFVRLRQEKDVYG